MTRYSLTLVWLLVLGQSPANAFKPDSPQRRDVFSPNRAFVLDANPGTGKHIVYAVNDRQTPLWSFSEPLWLGPIFLSNDGQVVAILAWKHVKADGLDGANCVSFWNKAGRMKAYTFGELCPSPRRRGWFEIGPVGSFWRVWYSEARQEGDDLAIETTDLYGYTFSMGDGAIRDRRLLVENVVRKSWLPVLLLLGGGVVLLFVRARRRKAPTQTLEAPSEAITSRPQTLS
jgi:hypothetical protein